MQTIVDAYPTTNPGDAYGLQKFLETLPPGKVKRLALIGKTEGTATINDFSRQVAVNAAEKAIKAFGGETLLERSTIIFSTGCEGVLSPCVYVFSVIDNDDVSSGASERPLLSMGGAQTRPIHPTELVTFEHVRLVSDAVRASMAEAGLSANQVELVFVKSPILTHQAAVRTGDDAVIARAGSSGQSRGAAALGVALGLGEIGTEAMRDVKIGADLDQFSSKCMSFSGTEVDVGEVLVLGNRPGQTGEFRVHSTLIEDILDLRSIKKMLLKAGCSLDEFGELEKTDLLTANFLKAGVDPSGLVRGNRTTIFQSELDPDKHMRAAASGLIGGLLGTGQLFVSGGAEHQAMPGGGLFACITKVKTTSWDI